VRGSGLTAAEAERGTFAPDPGRLSVVTGGRAACRRRPAELPRAGQQSGVVDDLGLGVGAAAVLAEWAVTRAGRHRLVNPRTGRVTATVGAAELFGRICAAAWAGGDPGLLFTDRTNRDNPLPSLGRIQATNPSGEVPLLPYESCDLDQRRPGKTKSLIQNGRWRDNPVLSPPGFTGPGPIACHQLTELARPAAMIPAPPRAVGHHRCTEDGPGQAARVLVPGAGPDGSAAGDVRPAYPGP
jgi:hypothetical protein